MSCVSVVIPALPSVSQTLVESLTRKMIRDEVSDVPEIWRRIVFSELDWCATHLSDLSYLHRLNACKLIDWHHSYYGYTREDWLAIYPSRQEMYRRQVVAELDWCATHLDELTPRHRDKAIDLLEDFYATNPEDYQSSWNVLLKF